MRKTVIAVAAALGLAVVVALTLWATGVVGDDDAVTTESCDGVTLRLESEEDDGVREASMELVGATPGETWQVRVEHAGKVVLDSERTADEDGEVDADVYLPRDATGEITATATSGDRSCTAVLSLP